MATQEAPPRRHSHRSNTGDPLDVEESPEYASEDALVQSDEPVLPDVSGWAVNVLIRDSVWFQQGTKLGVHRAARVVNVLVLIFGTIAVQVFLLDGVWRLLCRRQVHRIRVTYDRYERLMYPNHTTLTVNGFHRGVPGYRQDERFLLMDTAIAERVCEIPLSHPVYLTTLIFIWTLTCQVELRGILEKAYQLLVRTPTVGSLKQVLKCEDDNQQIAHVQGLTLPLKFVIGGLIELPRAVCILLLLWLGCRWLVSTLGLGKVLLNAVALEFILLLDDLAYSVCASHRNRISTESLFIKPMRKLNKASCLTFFDAQGWGFICLIWSVVYVYFLQQVLPDYRWDVHDLCNAHLDYLVMGKTHHKH